MASDKLKLEPQVVVNCSKWVLGTELGFTVRMVHALKREPPLSPLMPFLY